MCLPQIVRLSPHNGPPNMFTVLTLDGIGAARLGVRRAKTNRPPPQEHHRVTSWITLTRHAHTRHTNAILPRIFDELTTRLQRQRLHRVYAATTTTQA